MTLPELNRANLAPTPGKRHLYVVRDEAAEGDLLVRCPLGGTWTTFRPEPYAFSAAQAHWIQHRKGWPLDCELPDTRKD